MNSPVLTDCLEFSSKLVSSGKLFKFSVTIGTSFVFNLSSIESGTSSSMNENKKKKPSPSTRQRNAARVQKFLEKKNTSSKDTFEDASNLQDTTSINFMNNDKKTFHCNQCKFKNVSGQELSKHMKVRHISVRHISSVISVILYLKMR